MPASSGLDLAGHPCRMARWHRGTRSTQAIDSKGRTSEKNMELIDHLNLYIRVRSFEQEYKEIYNIFGVEFKFGYSRDEKIDAAESLIAVLLGNAPEASLDKHLDALNSGKLGKIVNYHLNGKRLNALIDKIESKEHLNEFKKRYTEVKQNSYEEKIDLPSHSNEFKR